MPSRVSPWTIYDVFTVANGEQLFIGAVSDKQWDLLCTVIGRHDLLEDPALRINEQRLKVRGELLETIGETLLQHDLQELSAKLEKAGLPYAPIVRPDELLHDEHLKKSGGLVPMQTDEGDTTDVVLLPLMMDGKRPQVRQSLARLGEHTEEVLSKLKSYTAKRQEGVQN